MRHFKGLIEEDWDFVALFGVKKTLGKYEKPKKKVPFIGKNEKTKKVSQEKTVGTLFKN